MFVKVYRYKIKESDLEESRRISKDADLIYATYGRDKEPIILYKKVNDLVEVLLIEFYNSKEDYEKTLEIYGPKETKKRIEKMFEASTQTAKLK